MDEVLKQLMQFIIAGSGFIFLLFFLFNFLTKGYFAALLKAKASQGKLVVLRIKGALGYYAVTGKLKGGWLIWKDKAKVVHRLERDAEELQNYIVYTFGVAEITMNEDGSIMIDRDLRPTHQQGQNSTDNDVLYTRIINTPKKEGKKEAIVQILVVLIFIAVLILFFRVNMIMETLQAIPGVAGVI